MYKLVHIIIMVIKWSTYFVLVLFCCCGKHWSPLSHCGCALLRVRQFRGGQSERCSSGSTVHGRSWVTPPIVFHYSQIHSSWKVLRYTCTPYMYSVYFHLDPQLMVDVMLYPLHVKCIFPPRSTVHWRSCVTPAIVSIPSYS